MRYVAAYLLAALGGKAQPSADDIKKILSSVGIEADQAKLDKVLSELKDKKIEDVIAEGSEKLASVPSGGGGGAAPAAGGAAAGGAAEAKKEPEPEPEEEDEDMGFDLFD
eukprot:m.284349 g.284349  ORF g.284349 m.284349 type:complete len:110 (-) comp11124_c0_seq1:58-387(-)